VIHAPPRAGLALQPVEARPESPAARLPPYTAQRTAMGRTANSAVVGSMAAISEDLPLLRGSTNAEKRRCLAIGRTEGRSAACTSKGSKPLCSSGESGELPTRLGLIRRGPKWVTR